MYPIILVLLASACRLIPHAPNFTPIGAMALFAGSEIKDLRLALGATLGAMVLSDLVIGADITSASVYLALSLSVMIGRYFRSGSSIKSGFFSALACAVLFFIVTNFAVWTLSGIYPLTIAGFADCFTLAIPFFRNSLVSDLLYLGALSFVGHLARLNFSSRLLTSS